MGFRIEYTCNYFFHIRWLDVGKRFLPVAFDSVIGINPKYMYADRRAELEQRIWAKK